MPNTILGLVCLTSASAPKADRISYRTITKTSLEKLTPTERRIKLTSIYSDNALMLVKAINYCADHQIRMYRMSSSAFPFADMPEYTDLLPPTLLRCAGDNAKRHGIRLLSHPDQFCVLSSDKLNVIENSIRMLTLEAHVFDLIGLPQSHWAPINVHIGRKGPEALATIRSVIADLAPNIKSRLTLENDEFKQDALSTIETCIDTAVACLFDYHHELVAKSLYSYDEPTLETYRKAASVTWTNIDWAVCHLSNGAAGLHDKAHSDLISRRPTDMSRIPWLEIEAKGKEQAIAAFPW